MIAMLYTLGARAGAPKTPAALRPAVIAAASASRIGDSSIQRVSSISRASFVASGLGAIMGTMVGAANHTRIASGMSASIIRLAIVATTRFARTSSPFASRAETTGTRAEPTAPAATSWKSVSGIRKAARKASRLALWPPYSARKTVVLTQPRTRERNTPATTTTPASAIARPPRRVAEAAARFGVAGGADSAFRTTSPATASGAAPYSPPVSRGCRAAGLGDGSLVLLPPPAGPLTGSAARVATRRPGERWARTHAP